LFKRGERVKDLESRIAWALLGRTCFGCPSNVAPKESELIENGLVRVIVSAGVGMTGRRLRCNRFRSSERGEVAWLGPRQFQSFPLESFPGLGETPSVVFELFESP
jgi:hypothetical protein